MKKALLIANFLMTLAFASTAQADVRFAEPGRNGPEPCTQEDPCSLKNAIENAATGDEVIVTAGTYTVKAGLNPGVGVEDVYIHGDLAGPMPRIEGKAEGSMISNEEPGGRIEYLQIKNGAPNGGGLTCAQEGRIDRVAVEVLGQPSVGITLGDSCVVRDSLVRTTAPESMALLAIGTTAAETGLVRNVTAIATGAGSFGIRSTHGGATPGTYTLDVRNTIADGPSGDLEAILGIDGPGNIVVANSNFDKAVAAVGTTLTDLGGNQTAPPLFVDAAGGNFREAAASPTIDAGANDQLGALDLDGNARVLGPAPDIGAFETAVPPPPPPIASTAEILSLSIGPKAFKAANLGGAVASAKKPAKKGPIGTTVSYALSAAGTVSFSVERKTGGRRAGKTCVKKTKANSAKKKCSLFKPISGGFTHTGIAGANSFKFSGRIGSSALKPGSYKLVGKTGTSSRDFAFKIVK
jgi:hypothetical protein